MTDEAAIGEGKSRTFAKPGFGWLDRIVFLDLCGAVILSVLAFGAVEPWAIAAFELNAFLVGVMLAARYVFSGRLEMHRLRLLAPVAALLLLGLVQILPLQFGQPPNPSSFDAMLEIKGRTLSLDPFATSEVLLKLLALAIYFFAALHTLAHSERRKIAVYLLTGFGFAVSVFAIAHRLTNNGKMYWVRSVSGYIAPYGPYGNYNHFAGFVELILPFPLACLLFLRGGLDQRMLWLFGTVIMGAAVLFSLSRGGTLAIGIEVALLLAIAYLYERRESGKTGVTPRMLALIAAGIPAGIAILALWIGSDRLADRLNQTRQGAREFSVATRLEYWAASWKMFLDHPAAGVGLGAFGAAYPSYGRSSAKFERLEQAHNDYLQLLTDAGLIGAALGLWFLYEILRIARRQYSRLSYARSRTRATILGGYTAILGILTHSFTDFNLQIPANGLLFFFVLALTASAHAGQRISEEFE
jgi:O-antigen ligase